MRYYDKNGNQILAGMHLCLEDGSIEKIYSTTSSDGSPDLGISASNEMFLKHHPEMPREYYSLSSFQSSLKNAEIVKE